MNEYPPNRFQRPQDTRKKPARTVSITRKVSAESTADLEKKRQMYIELMTAYDSENKTLRQSIRSMSSNSDEPKGAKFHRKRKRLQSRIKYNMDQREACRVRVSRINQTVKNKNRHLSNGIAPEGMPPRPPAPACPPAPARARPPAPARESAPTHDDDRDDDRDDDGAL